MKFFALIFILMCNLVGAQHIEKTDSFVEVSLPGTYLAAFNAAFQEFAKDSGHRLGNDVSKCSVLFEVFDDKIRVIFGKKNMLGGGVEYTVRTSDMNVINRVYSK